MCLLRISACQVHTLWMSKIMNIFLLYSYNKPKPILALFWNIALLYRMSSYTSAAYITIIYTRSQIHNIIIFNSLFNDGILFFFFFSIFNKPRICFTDTTNSRVYTFILPIQVLRLLPFPCCLWKVHTYV